MKVALITGASRGIGKEVALGLAEDGYDLALLATQEERLKHTAQEIRSHFPERHILTFALDIANEHAVEAALQSTHSEFGRIDVVFNNAGIYRAGTTDLSLAEFRRVLEVNLIGAFTVAQAVVPIFRKQGSGYLINISSVCGVIGWPGVGGYTASKFGVMGLNESLFRELVPQGIKVTALCPSWVATDLSTHAPFPASEMIQPLDLLKTVRYLLSLSPKACPRELVIECVSDPR